MDALTLPSFAKVNLFLEILGLRTDGYHELRTLFQTVSLHDELHFTKTTRGIELQVEGMDLGPPENNLVYRAASLLAKRFLPGAGAGIRLTKRIPGGAGLGGGSSNAAVTLVGLSRLWGLPLGNRQLLPLAAELGADVPFFLVGGSALGLGRGDLIYPTTGPNVRWMIILYPGFTVSTAEAYSLLSSQLTLAEKCHKITSLCLLLPVRQGGALHFFNAFEETISGKHPEIREVRECLLKSGALAAQLSGSGSAVVGIYSSRAKAEWALSRIEQHSWKAYLVERVDRAKYQRILFSKKDAA